MSPEGTANFQFPDNSARYWIMPFDTLYETMTIKGTYPNIRYFSFTAYETIDGGFKIPPEHLFDAQIAPDPGSINPFVPPGGRNGTYTVVISRTGTSSGNTIGVSSDLVWVLLRMYVADTDPSQSGQSLMGGVSLPAIKVTDQTGASRQLDACTPVNKWQDLSDFVTSPLSSGRSILTSMKGRRPPIGSGLRHLKTRRRSCGLIGTVNI